MADLLKFMYKSEKTNIEGYNPPDEFEHGEEVVVGKIKATNEDGHDTIIYEGRLPARFFTIKVVGEEYSISTGSGGDELLEFVFQLARMIADDMLAVDLGV